MKLLKNFILILAMLFLMGASCDLKDSTMPPIDGNFYTQEIVSCTDKTDFGFGGCYYTSSDSTTIDKKFISIPLMYKGEYQIRSRNCIYSRAEKYEGDQVLKLPVSELIQYKPSSEDHCLFDVYVKPERKNQDKGIQGQFILYDMEEFIPAKASMGKGDAKQALHFGRNFSGIGWYQMREGFSKDIALDLYTSHEGAYEYIGCDRDGNGRYKNNFSIKLSDMYGKRRVKDSCMMVVTLAPDDVDIPMEIFVMHLQIFSNKIIQLADPIIEIKKDKIKIKIDENEIALATINGKSFTKKNFLSSGISGKLLKEKDNIVKIYTINGRGNMFKIKDGKIIKWMPVVY